MKINWIKYFVLIACCVITNTMWSQTFNIVKSVDTTNPDVNDPFIYTIDASCPSTSLDCGSSEIIDCLPPELEFLNFSDPPAGINPEYDPDTHCVSFEFDDFTAGATIQLKIQVRFPLGTFEGTTVINTANGTAENTPPASADAPPVTVNGGIPETFGCDQLNPNISTPYELVPGGEFWIRTGINHTGSTDIDNFVITTPISAGTVFSYVQVPRWLNNDQDVDIYYESSLSPGTYTYWRTFNTASDGNKRYYSTDLSLDPGETVRSIRTDFGTLSGDGSWNLELAGAEGWEGSMRIYSLVDGSVVAGDIIDACSVYTGTINGTNCEDSDCDATDIVEGEAKITGGKDIQDPDTDTYASTFGPGDIYKVRLAFASEASNNETVIGGVLVDVLPPGMTYVDQMVVNG